MNKRVLGKTGLEVSEVGLGAWQLGDLKSTDAAFRILDTAFELGINYIDTSDNYGKSELYIGKWLRSRKPTDAIVATKISCGPDWTLAAMRERIDLCLERLQMATVDIIKLHNPGIAKVEQGDVHRVLEEAQDEGKIRWIGISEDAPTAQRCLELQPFDVLQVDYSMITRLPEKGLFDYVAKHQMGVVARMVFGRFVFNRVLDYDWESPMQERAISMRLNAWFERYPKHKPHELMLRYVLTNPHLNCALIGTSNPEHVRTNVVAADRGPLPVDILEDFYRWTAPVGD